MNLDLREDQEGIIIKIHVSPGSSRNVISGLYGDALAVKISAPAVEGKANLALSRFLADVFRTKKRQVEIIRGDRSRRKFVRIKGISAARAKEILGSIISGQ